MDTNLEHALTKLAQGSLLRIKGGQGQAVAVFRGLVWITQDGDSRDLILGDGESFTLDRPGLAIVQALRDSDLLRVEKDDRSRNEGRAPRIDAHEAHATARALRRQAYADAAKWLASRARQWWAAHSRHAPA